MNSRTVRSGLGTDFMLILPCQSLLSSVTKLVTNCFAVVPFLVSPWELPLNGLMSVRIEVPAFDVVTVSLDWVRGRVKGENVEEELEKEEVGGGENPLELDDEFMKKRRKSGK